MSGPKISKVLHLAADKYLSEMPGDGKAKFSCWAIEDALNELAPSRGRGAYDVCYHLPRAAKRISQRVQAGLQAMGCETGSSYQFREFESKYDGLATPESQGARYLWLKWAALMAEEQGL